MVRSILVMPNMRNIRLCLSPRGRYMKYLPCVVRGQLNNQNFVAVASSIEKITIFPM